MSKKAHSNSDKEVGKMNHILVIEDDETIRFMLNKLLVRHGFNIILATNVNSALHAWRKNSDSIKLVISDFQLEYKTAEDILTIIKEANPLTKLILMSASNTSEIPKNFMSCIDFFFQKPIIFTELLEAINDLS
ncbi:MAG: response regulator [bacterium]